MGPRRRSWKQDRVVNDASFSDFLDASSHLYTPKMSRFLCENHRGSPTLTLLNKLGVLGVLGVLNVLN